MTKAGVWVLAAGLGALTLASTGDAATAAPTPAVPVGPVCFSTAPFSDILVWFVDFKGATPNWNYLDATGQDLAGNRSEAVSVITDHAGTTAKVGYTTYPQAGFVPVVAGGTIDLATGTGPGQCFAPDALSCGAFTFAKITCPATALPLASGPVQGQN